MSSYHLPASSFMQKNDKTDGGKCLFSSIGNALADSSGIDGLLAFLVAGDPEI
jgi:hypothetical protein